MLGVDLEDQEDRLALQAPGAQLPVLLVRGLLRPRGSSSAGATSWCTRIDRQTGKAAWTFTTRARVDSSPVVAGGRVYVGSNDGKLYVLDAASGKSVFEFEAGGPAVRLARPWRRDGS